MNFRFFCLILISLFSGCAYLGPKPTNISQVVTMRTDLYPDGITRTEYYNNMAWAYKSQLENEKAIENFKLALLHDDRNVKSLVGLGEVYLEQDQSLHALNTFARALEVEPKNNEIKKKIGDLYLKQGLYSKARETYASILQADQKFEEALWAVYFIYKLERRYDDALMTLAKIPMTDVNGGKLAFEKSITYKMKQNYALYDHYLEEALRLNPRHRDTILEYARRSYEKSQYSEAMEALLNYSNTVPFDYEISKNLSFAAARSENYKLALREYDKQLVINEEDLNEILLNKAHCLFLMGEFKPAEAIYTRLAVETYSDEARYYLGQIFFSQEKMEQAAAILSQVPKESEFYGDSMIKLALYYKYIGDRDQAINVMRDAYMQRHDLPDIYKTYGDFLIEDKKYVEAVALIEKGIYLFPKDEELRLKMAYLHFRLNNQKSFKKQIKAALRINPNSADAYSMLSELWYLKNQNVEETAYFVNKAMQLKSKNKNIKPILAWTLMQKNRSTEAVALFEEFYEENPNESFFARSLSQVYRRGGVTQKSKVLSKVAQKLELEDSLRSRFIFKDQTQKVNAEKFLETRSRLPASLEN